jgi:2-dehydropantoate 2-reductase
MSTGTIWVVGAGAVGSVTAARLRSDPPCRLIDAWAEHVAAIRADGLRLDYADATLCVSSFPAYHLDEIERIQERPDVILLAVKSNSTVATVNGLLPFMTDTTVVVSLQNGVNEETISDLAGPERTIGAAVSYGGELVAPGRIRTPSAFNGVRPRLVIGELDGVVTPRLRRLADRLGSSVPVEVTDNIWGRLWSKLIVNVQVNALCALTGLTTDEIAADPSLRGMSLTMASEAIGVASELGLTLDPALVWGDPDMPLDTPDAASKQAVEQTFMNRWTAPTKPSMLQDVEKGRPTEIDALNGYVVAKAHQTQVTAPANEAVVRLVKELETSAQRTGRDGIRDELHSIHESLARR